MTTRDEQAAWLYLQHEARSCTPRRCVFGYLVYCLRELFDPRRELTPDPTGELEQKESEHYGDGESHSKLRRV